MGYTTREMQSGPLSSNYPALYEEMQYLNWCPVEVVITRMTGKQEIIPAWPRGNNGNHHLTIIRRECNGPRSQLTKFGSSELDIPCKEYTINLDEFSSYPLRMDEIGVIISTKEMALVAKDMIRESEYRLSNETYSDTMTVDPRFVFEVRDPFNRWECLYVNVFGQTITLRCGHKGQLIPDLDEATLALYNDECTLSCYLRYPSNYIQAEREIVPVFTINLSDIDKGEPYRLPTGDMICVASSMEGLQDVLARKHVGSASPNFAALGMVSKDVHDQLVKRLTDQVTQEKANTSNQLRALRTKHEVEQASSKAELDKLKRANEALQSQVETFNTLHKSMLERAEREEKLLLQREKSRSEQIANDEKALDRTYTVLKVGGTVVAGVLAYALTQLSKSKK